MATRKPLVQLQANLGEMPAGDAVGVAQGGTGATTAPAALTSLGAYPATNPGGFITGPQAPVQSVAGRAGTITLGVADVSGALSTAAAAATYAPLNNPSFAGNNYAFGAASTASAMQFEVGSTTTANYLYFDLHSSGTGSDFDVRIDCQGGTATSGQGAYGINASSFKFNGYPVLTAAAPVTIAQGGTGATTAPAALSGLGAYPASNPSGYIAASGAPVQSIAGRTGAVTLGVADVSGALPAVSGSATNLSLDALQVNGNLGGANIPPGLSAIGWNYTAGDGETSFFNNYTGASAAAGPLAFAWRQKLTSTTTRTLMTLSQAGVPGFAQPVPITSGGTGGNTQATARTGLGLSAVAASGSYGDLLNPPAIPAGSNAVPAPNGTAAAGTNAAFSRSDHAHASDTTRVAKTGDTMSGPLTVQGVLAAYQLCAYAAPTSAAWQGQGSYVGWNYSGGGGETDFVNSRGGGVGGFKWYNTDSAANSVPNLLATLDAAGNLALAGSTAASDVNIAGTGGMAGAWNSYQATVSASTGTISTALATVRYKKVSRLVFFNLYASITNNGSGAGALSVSLPFANNGSSPLMMLSRDLNSLTIVSGYIGPSAASIAINRVSDNAYPVAANGAAGFAFAGVYEAAA